MNLPELLKIAEANCADARPLDVCIDYDNAFTPKSIVELIKRLQEAEKELSALSGLIFTVERAYSKGNLTHRMQDDYERYIAAMKGSK